MKEPLSNLRGGNNVFAVIILKAKTIPSGYDVMCVKKELHNVIGMSLLVKRLNLLGFWAVEICFH